ncbi:transposase [Streptomyces sp. NPDC093808]|uniref:transposase n=1 Tax=Streptomyces sp. NPDC093808 TaxID=3154985 RepID=UPI00344BD028
MVAGAGYGDAAAFRHGLEERGLPCTVGISSRHTAHPAGARPVQPALRGHRPTAGSAVHRARADRERSGHGSREGVRAAGVLTRGIPAGRTARFMRCGSPMRYARRTPRLPRSTPV